MKLIALIVTATALLFAETKPQPKGTVQRIKVHGKSLEGNLEGDSPDRDVTIYLPPGYDANRNQRIPSCTYCTVTSSRTNIGLARESPFRALTCLARTCPPRWTI